MIRAALEWVRHALCLDHRPALSAAWCCPCKLCALANPDKLTPADRDAKLSGVGWCRRPFYPSGSNTTEGFCRRAAGHEGRCLR